MSDETTTEISEDDQEITKADKTEKHEDTEIGVVKRSDRTVKQRVKDAKQRAIDKFEHGELDDEYRVVRMANGKYRTYKRKEPLAPTPINVNQVAANKPRKEIMIEDDDDEPTIEKR